MQIIIILDKVTYENINTRAQWKKLTRDVKIIDKTNIVIDLSNELSFQ